MAIKSLRARVSAEISRGLAPSGFKCQGKESPCLLPVREGWFGWLGLNARVHPGYCEINPVVGVRYTELERLSSTLRAAKYMAYSPPSLSTTLSFLMGNTKRWEFYNDVDPSPKVSEVISDIIDVGLPFMREHCTLEDVFGKLTPWSRSDAKGDAYRYPVALVLLGRTDEAIDYAKAWLESLPPSRSEVDYSKQYGAFADRLFNFIENGSASVSARG